MPARARSWDELTSLPRARDFGRGEARDYGGKPLSGSFNALERTVVRATGLIPPGHCNSEQLQMNVAGRYCQLHGMMAPMKSPFQIILVLSGLVALVVLLGFVAYRLATNVSEPKRLAQRFMARKTAAARQIRDGLASKSFRLARKGVKKLRRISNASKRYLHGSQYAYMSATYRAALELTDAAITQRNADKLAEAYKHLVISCTHCHAKVAKRPIDLGLR
jgi:hypothetical protein